MDLYNGINMHDDIDIYNDVDICHNKYHIISCGDYGDSTSCHAIVNGKSTIAYTNIVAITVP
jgi:hypothetical protein